MKCCVPSCGMTADNYGPIVLDNNLKEVTFHEFPTVPWLRKSWLVGIGIRERHLPQGAVVCSQHFQKYDFNSTTKKLRKKAVPSTFIAPSSDSTSLDFCLICLDTGASKLFPLNKNHLARAYSNIIGLDMSDVCDLIANPKLCSECAHRLNKCDTFKHKALRAHSVLIQLLLKDKAITLKGLKSVNREGNLLTSSLVKDAFKPDHYDLYVTHNEDENNIPKKENIICNPQKKSNSKSKKNDKTIHDCKKRKTVYKKENLSGPGDSENNDFKVSNNVINIDHKVHDKNIGSHVVYYKDKSNDVNTANSDKIANNKSDVFIIYDSDDSDDNDGVEFIANKDTVHYIDDDMKGHDIGDVSKCNMSDDIDHDIYDGKRDMIDDIDHDIDEDVKRDVIDDIGHDIDDGSKRNIIDEDVRRDVIDDIIDHDIDVDVRPDVIDNLSHDIDEDVRRDVIDDIIDHDIDDIIDHDIDDDVTHDVIDDIIDHDIDHDIDDGVRHDVINDIIDHDIDDDVRHDVISDIIDHDIDNDVRHDVIDDIIDHDIDDDVRCHVVDDIDYDIDVDIDHDVDSDNIDIDMDHDVDELVKDNHSSNTLLNKLKIDNQSENQNLGVNNGTKCKNKTAKPNKNKTIK